jgi:hypothetical protein
VIKLSVSTAIRRRIARLVFLIVVIFFVLGRPQPTTLDHKQDGDRVQDEECKQNASFGA